MSEDDQFNQAFGKHTRISLSSRKYINDMRQLARRVKDFTLKRSDADRFTDQAWRLLGRYIANNTHLEKITLNDCGISNEKMASLFYELTYSTSLRQLDLSVNSFGMDGLRSMVPLLNDTNLSYLRLSHNNNINTECFELLIQTLHGRPLQSRFLKSLIIGSCNITNISALETHNLPYLQTLVLTGNNIGREGFITISNLLQQESNLDALHLLNVGMGDEEAEILANSLNHNTKLNSLDLQRNNITERGYKAFLKLLVDMSSIKSTYNSNHTLTYLWLRRRADTTMIRHINLAVELNRQHRSSRVAGKAKVINYQLYSNKRKEMCHVQGIEYRSIGNVFTDIEPTLLPRILALIGENHGQREFYRALIQMVPDLMSCVDTSGMMKALLVKNKAQADSLRQQANALMQQASVITAENSQLSGRLAARESGDSHYSTTEKELK